MARPGGAKKAATATATAPKSRRRAPAAVPVAPTVETDPEELDALPPDEEADDEPEDDDDYTDDELADPTPAGQSLVTQPRAAVVAPQTVEKKTKRARVKGTWTQVYGGSMWDFQDDKVYELPLDLYNYLKAHGCIYDTAR